MTDKRTSRPRGFGFITFKDVDSVNQVLMRKDQHQISGKWIDVKSAVPVDDMAKFLNERQARTVIQMRADYQAESK